jgi:hypothetical protein
MFDMTMISSVLLELTRVTGAAAGTCYGVYNLITTGASVASVMALLGPGGTLGFLTVAAIRQAAIQMGRRAFVIW